MSSKKSLAKKIAHTLMAMSIVYSSGINIVVNQVYAAETKNLNNSDSQFVKNGEHGNAFDGMGGVSDGESVDINGIITANSIANEIKVAATGGTGGSDRATNPTVEQGARGGDAVAKVTVASNVNNVTLRNVTVSAFGGNKGGSYQGTAGINGAAAAYGLEAKHDLTIEVAAIKVAAEIPYYSPLSAKAVVDTGEVKSSGTTAVGLQVESGNISFTGTSINVNASTYADGYYITEISPQKLQMNEGGSSEAYGIRVQGGKLAATLSGDIVLEKAFGGTGDSVSTYTVGGDDNALKVITEGKGVAGGDGGTVVASGVEVNDGTVQLDLRNIIHDSDASNFYYISGGGGGIGHNAENTGADVQAGKGGNGGRTMLAGVHISGGQVDGSIGTIKLKNEAAKARGGQGGQGVNTFGGSGGDGGEVYVAGVNASGGLADLTIEGIEIAAAGSRGGDAGMITITESDLFTATGKVQASGGTGSKVTAVGVDNRTNDSKMKVENNIKLTATGGDGGDLRVNGSSAPNISPEAVEILISEAISGKGGAAMAAGLQNTAGSLQAEVQKLEITAIGGKGGNGLSTYTANNGIGGTGGAAAAYGINVLGGLAERLTVAEITVAATGGSGGTVFRANDGDSKPSETGEGILGGKGGTGADAKAYGISNSGGLANAEVAKITAQAIGGTGGVGGGVAKKYGSGFDAKGTGGDGGNGGNAYAYGVFGTDASSHTVIAVDDIVVSAVAGAGGAGAAAAENNNGYNGVGTEGNDGSAGAEAKAYGIYAASGAVVDLHAKTSAGTIRVNAQAIDASAANEAYAVYADRGTVLFGSNAQLNWDGNTGKNNDLITRLNNATLGFSGTAADRKVTGGTLQLSGSNAFRFTTDLANDKADSMVFDTIENNDSKQYIQIGYEKAFENALSEADIVTISGDVNVLTINRLNGGKLDNFTGQASQLDSPLERFKVTPTVTVTDNMVNITEIALAKENAPSETVMTASDAHMALGSMWRIEGNNLMKRMGELRSDSEAAQGGVWARYYRGELSADSAYGREFNQDYTAFQGGIDKVQDYKGGKLYTGIAVNRIDSNAGYKAGSGDLSSTGVGLYASWLGSKGHYVDVIARGSKLANDFKLVDLSGNAAKGDYDTWAYGISAEYGYRQNLKAGWFVEPQAELSLGHINGADYEMSNGAVIKQDSVNSAVTRLGVLGGKEFSISGRPGNAYVKASVLHDFGGNGGATGYYKNDSLALQTGDLTGTWYELGLGANLGIAKNGNLYFDALKTFNGNLRTDWQFNAGLRFTF